MQTAFFWSLLGRPAVLPFQVVIVSSISIARLTQFRTGPGTPEVCPAVGRIAIVRWVTCLKLRANCGGLHGCRAQAHSCKRWISWWHDVEGKTWLYFTTWTKIGMRGLIKLPMYANLGSFWDNLLGHLKCFAVHLMVPCSSSQYHEPVLDIFCWKWVRVCCFLYTLLEIIWDWSTDEFSFAIVSLMGWLIIRPDIIRSSTKIQPTVHALHILVPYRCTLYIYTHIYIYIYTYYLPICMYIFTYLHIHMYVCIYQLAVNQNLHRLQIKPLISNQGSTSCDSMMGGGSTVPKPVVFWRVVWWSFR